MTNLGHHGAVAKKESIVETKETLLALHQQTGYYISNDDKINVLCQFQAVTSTGATYGNALIVIDNNMEKGTWFHENEKLFKPSWENRGFWYNLMIGTKKDDRC